MTNCFLTVGEASRRPAEDCPLSCPYACKMPQQKTASSDGKIMVNAHNLLAPLPDRSPTHVQSFPVPLRPNLCQPLVKASGGRLA